MCHRDSLLVVFFERQTFKEMRRGENQRTIIDGEQRDPEKIQKEKNWGCTWDRIGSDINTQKVWMRAIPEPSAVIPEQFLLVLLCFPSV